LCWDFWFWNFQKEREILGGLVVFGKMGGIWDLWLCHTIGAGEANLR
jgi:hypothetical protein